ncbi:hypothetical protein [Promicromonospora soli]
MIGLRTSRHHAAGLPADDGADGPGALPASWLWAQGGVAVLLNTILESPW